jgi:hypothetical protein
MMVVRMSTELVFANGPEFYDAVNDCFTTWRSAHHQSLLVLVISTEIADVVIALVKLSCSS